METVVCWLDIIGKWLWMAPLLLLVVCAGIFFTIKLRGLQFSFLGYGLKQTIFRNDNGCKGDLSHLETLTLALSGMIGGGNIAGVAIALATGGVGAIFWMWVVAGLGMAIRYSEVVLSIKYRTQNSRGEMCGGLMYYLDRGLGWKNLAVVCAVLGALSALLGSMSQAQTFTYTIQDVFDVSPWVVGASLAIVLGVLFSGGIKSIGLFTSLFVPVVMIFYVVGGIITLCFLYDRIPMALLDIFRGAFSIHAVSGGLFGSAMIMAMRDGAFWGIYSGDIGMGGPGIISAVAKTDSPSRHAVIAMTGIFWDTFVVCTITGLVYAVANTGVSGHEVTSGGLTGGIALMIKAFSAALPVGGRIIVTMTTLFFMYANILGWLFYGQKCSEYVFGMGSIIFYRWLLLALLVVGAIVKFDFLWPLANVFKGIIMTVNIIGLVGLSGVVLEETRLFISKVKKKTD